MPILHLLKWTGFIVSILCVTASVGTAKVDIPSEEYKKSCDSGNAQSCYDLGVLYYTASGVERNPGLAALLYARACEGEYWKACLELSRMYAQGLGVAKSKIKYIEFRKKACKFGHSSSCDFLIRNLFDSANRYIRRGPDYDEGKAIARFQKACELGSEYGCQRRRDLLGRKLVAYGKQYIRGDPDYDESKAAARFLEACELGNKQGCQLRRALVEFDVLIPVEDQNSEKTTANLQPMGSVLNFSAKNINKALTRCLAFFSSKAKWLKFQQIPQNPKSKYQIGLKMMIGASFLTSYRINEKNGGKSKVNLLTVLSKASPDTNWYLTRYRYNYLNGSHPWNSDGMLKNDQRKCQQLLSTARQLLAKGKLLKTLKLD